MFYFLPVASTTWRWRSNEGNGKNDRMYSQIRGMVKKRKLGHLPSVLWKDCERKRGRGGDVMSPVCPATEPRGSDWTRTEEEKNVRHCLIQY